MAARVFTVAFQGVEAVRVEVEVQLTSGEAHFMLVGLGDKAVAESRERIWAAFAALGLALPAKRIVVNLAPANLPKGDRRPAPVLAAPTPQRRAPHKSAHTSESRDAGQSGEAGRGPAKRPGHDKPTGLGSRFRRDERKSGSGSSGPAPEKK